MKTASSIGLFTILAIRVVAAPFPNLGFDEANTNNVRDDGVPPIDLFGPASEMLPGWQLLLGTNTEIRVGLNAFLPGLGYSSLMEPDNSGFGGQPLPAFDRFSLALFPNFVFVNSTAIYVPYSLMQVGGVPADAKSIQFTSYGGPFELLLNGTPVPLFYSYGPPTANPNTRQASVVGDISSFAGQTVELRLTTLDAIGSVVNGLDSISFSTEAIPEPRLLSLLGLGVVVMVAGRRRR